MYKYLILTTTAYRISGECDHRQFSTYFFIDPQLIHDNCGKSPRISADAPVGNPKDFLRLPVLPALQTPLLHDIYRAMILRCIQAVAGIQKTCQTDGLVLPYQPNLTEPPLLPLKFFEKNHKSSQEKDSRKPEKKGVKTTDPTGEFYKTSGKARCKEKEEVSGKQRCTPAICNLLHQRRKQRPQNDLRHPRQENTSGSSECPGGTSSQKSSHEAFFPKELSFQPEKPEIHAEIFQDEHIQIYCILHSIIIQKF